MYVVPWQLLVWWCTIPPSCHGHCCSSKAAAITGCNPAHATAFSPANAPSLLLQLPLLSQAMCKAACATDTRPLLAAKHCGSCPASQLASLAPPPCHDEAKPGPLQTKQQPNTKRTSGHGRASHEHGKTWSSGAVQCCKQLPLLQWCHQHMM
jgi:hypothetical protein